MTATPDHDADQPAGRLIEVGDRARVIEIHDHGIGLDYVVELDADSGVLVDLHIRPTTTPGAIRLLMCLHDFGLLLPTPTPPADAGTTAHPSTVPAQRGSADDDASTVADPRGGAEPSTEFHTSGSAPPTTPTDTPPTLTFTPPADGESYADALYAEHGLTPVSADEPAADNGRRPYRRYPGDDAMKAAARTLGKGASAKEVGGYLGVPVETAGRYIRKARENGVKI
jgi:hypothetical protein